MLFRLPQSPPFPLPQDTQSLFLLTFPSLLFRHLNVHLHPQKKSSGPLSPHKVIYLLHLTQRLILNPALPYIQNQACSYSIRFIMGFCYLQSALCTTASGSDKPGCFMEIIPWRHSMGICNIWGTFMHGTSLLELERRNYCSD